jgi:hypothetical protein
MNRSLLATTFILVLSLALPVAAQNHIRWLGKSANNTQVELTVFDIIVVPIPEQPGRIGVTVATAWRNMATPHHMDEIEWKTSGVGSLSTFGRPRPPTGRAAIRHTSYLVPKLSDHLYIITGNGGMARLDDEEEGEIRLPRQNDEVEWIGRFEVDDKESESMLLVFFDFNNGHITIPLTERVPPREGVNPLSEARDEHIRARVYGTTINDETLAIDFGLLSTSEGNAVELDLNGAIGLLCGDGSVVEPSKDSPPHWFDGIARILPDWEQRGQLHFDGAAQCRPVALEIALPGQTPLQLPLSPEAQGAKSSPITTPPALHGWNDGPGLRLELLDVGHTGKTNALTLRLRVINRCGSDLTFSPVAQFVLMADGRKISAQDRKDSDEDIWLVRDGATRVLELQYPLKRRPGETALDYHGFETDNTISLEVPRQ